MEVKYPALHDALNSVGSLFRFIDAGGNVSEDPNGTIYRITSIDQHPVVRTYACNSTTNSETVRVWTFAANGLFNNNNPALNTGM